MSYSKKLGEVTIRFAPYVAGEQVWKVKYVAPELRFLILNPKLHKKILSYINAIAIKMYHQAFTILATEYILARKAAATRILQVCFQPS